MKHLEGTWNVTALETEGNAISAAMTGESRIIVSGDRFTTVAMGASYGGVLRIDESVTPHTLDLLFDEGPHAGIASLAIYKMKGDSWTVCLGFAGSKRPTEFKTTAGSEHALETLTRESAANVANAKAKTTKTSANGASASSTNSTSNSNIVIAEVVSKYPAELNALSGDWSAHAIVMDGQPLPAEYLKVGRRTATGSELKVTMSGQVQVHAGFVVDPTQSPKHINYFDLKNPDKGFTQLGIYELNGDTLKACMGGKVKPRPTTFESVKGDGQTFSIWKKLKR
ncbi:MAG: TIGR03067 domain-containing protein [Gemmatimonadaceae bacterium]